MQLLLDQKHFLQLCDVGVVEFPQGLDLPQLEALLPGGILLLYLLYGDHLVGLGVYCLEYCPEGPVPQHPAYLVLLHLLLRYYIVYKGLMQHHAPRLFIRLKNSSWETLPSPSWSPRFIISRRSS